jgi:hypothetical protein
VAAFENVECLLFEENLLILLKIARQGCRGLIRYGDNFLCQRLRDVCGAGGAFDAVRREGLELGIVFDVETSV